MERIAIVSDEAAPGFEGAVQICLPLGIRAYELRKLDGARIPDVSEAAVAEVLGQVRAHGLTLLGISPGFCKICLDDARIDEELAGGFDAAFRLMDRLGVRRMTVFSYLRSSRAAPIPTRVLELLARAAARCRAEGVELLLENSPQCWADTGLHLAQVAAAVGLPVTWDPANAAAAGEAAYPTGYEAVRGRVAHLHLKNWHRERGHVYLNDGVVDLPGQLRALQADGYAGYYCIESHRWSDPGATETNLRQLLALLPENGAAIHRRDAENAETT
jgi:sugar phosphate isomerase/epimerase